MRIVVFGAAGGTGKHVVELGLAGGHEITAFVHNNRGLDESAANLHIVTGDALIAEDVKKAVTNQEAVISTLGAGTSQQPIVSQGTKNIVDAMNELGLKRLIVQSAHGAGESAKQIPFFVRWLVRGRALKSQFEDKDLMESIVKQSSLDWTIVRPTRLTDDAETRKFRVGERIPVGMSPSISRSDVARFLLEQLESTEYIRKTPTITS